MTLRATLQWLAREIAENPQLTPQMARSVWLPEIFRALQEKPAGLKSLEIGVASILSRRDQVGRVELQVGEAVAEMETDEAREIGAWLIQCAEATESDHFIMHFATTKLGADKAAAAVLVNEFRPGARGGISWLG